MADYGSVPVHHLDASAVLPIFLPKDRYNKHIANHFRIAKSAKFKISKMCLGEITKAIIYRLDETHQFGVQYDDAYLLGRAFSLLRDNILGGKFEIVEPSTKTLQHLSNMSNKFVYGYIGIVDIFLLAHACEDGQAVEGNKVKFIHANPKHFENEFLKAYAKQNNVEIVYIGE